MVEVSHTSRDPERGSLRDSYTVVPKPDSSRQYYGFESARALEDCLNNSILPRLTREAGAVQKFITGIERFAVEVGDDGILELRVKPKADYLPGLRRDGETANICLSRVMNMLPKSLRSMFGARVQVDDLQADLGSIHITESSLFQERLALAVKDKLERVGAKPGVVKFFRITFGDEHERVSLDPNRKRFSKRLREKFGLDNPEHDQIKTYLIVDIEIQGGFIYPEQARAVKRELAQEFSHIENLEIRFPKEVYELDETPLLEPRSFLVSQREWEGELTADDRAPGGSVKRTRRLARIRRGSLELSDEILLRTKYDLLRVYDLRKLPFAAIDSPDSGRSASGRGPEDAVCFMELGNDSIYQLTVFPLREYPREFGLKGKPPKDFRHGREALVIFNGRLINPDGSPGKQHSGLGLVDIRCFMAPGERPSDPDVEESIEIGIEGQYRRREWRLQQHGEIVDVTAVKHGQLNLGDAMIFAYEGLTLEFYGSGIPLLAKVLPGLSERDPLYRLLEAEFPEITPEVFLDPNSVFGLIDKIDSKAAYFPQDRPRLEAMRELLLDYSDERAYRPLYIGPHKGSSLPNIARFKRGPNQRQLVSRLETTAAVSRGQRGRATRPLTHEEVLKICERNNRSFYYRYAEDRAG